MVKVFCDICKREISEEDPIKFSKSYSDYLKEKGEGALLVDISKVAFEEDMFDSDRCYYSKPYNICNECNEAVVKAVLDVIGNA